ncbi:hypothetical protein BDW22DRAFT_1351469, partial [Trametopsis cervina]
KLRLATSSSAPLSFSLWTSAGFLHAIVDPLIPESTTRILATNLSYPSLGFTSTGFCLILPSLHRHGYYKWSLLSSAAHTSTVLSTSRQRFWSIIGLDMCPAGHTLVHSWIQSTFVNIDNDTLFSQH